LSDKERNEVIRHECSVKEDVVIKIERNMLRWFGHVEKMDERRLTEGIYVTVLSGNAAMERPILSHHHHSKPTSQRLPKPPPARRRIPGLGQRHLTRWADRAEGDATGLPVGCTPDVHRDGRTSGTKDRGVEAPREEQPGR
jgi:hypothetical protein